MAVTGIYANIIGENIPDTTPVKAPVRQPIAGPHSIPIRMVPMLST